LMEFDDAKKMSFQLSSAYLDASLVTRASLNSGSVPSTNAIFSS
jgi:hypothetical protein